jgi:hypothetical protein
VPARQLGEQSIEAELGQAARSVARSTRLSKTADSAARRRVCAEQRDRQGCQRLRSPERPIERGEVGGDALPRRRRRPARSALGRTRVDQLLPLRRCCCTRRRLVHVGDVHARAHVFARQVLQAPALGARHLGGVAARRVRLDELAERALEPVMLKRSSDPDALQQRM